MRHFTVALFSRPSQQAPTRCHGQNLSSGGGRFVKCLTRGLFFVSFKVVVCLGEWTFEMDFLGALAAVKNNMRLGYDFKKEQQDILWKLNEKEHVFAQLPTRFVKSVCFAIHSLVQDKLVNDDMNIFIKIIHLEWNIEKKANDKQERVYIFCLAITSLLSKFWNNTIKYVSM